MCTTEYCDRPAWQCGLCQRCYARKRRADKVASGAYRRDCAVCGKTFDPDRATRTVCSTSCRSVRANGSASRTHGHLAVANATRSEAATVDRKCKRCGIVAVPRGRHYCDGCKATAKRSRRSELVNAMDDGDHARVIALARSGSAIDGNGCWIWPKLDGAGYPVGRGKRGMHRIVLEAKHGKPLGVLHAHHKCATPACVNPDHLQPVTQADNAAEMLARRSYIDRIAELESALAELAPNHPLLNHIAS